MTSPSVSIVISSYNYARFLRQAIDSALGQTYRDVEVVVVDDASTDGSPEIIASYGDRVVPVLRKHNRGGRAAYDEACRLGRGEVLLILDSDDLLFPTAVERAVGFFEDPAVADVHWPLEQIDAGGRPTGERVGRVYASHDLRQRVIRDGPSVCESVPTSGHAWSRRFLETAVPLPSQVRGDAYVSLLASLRGTVAGVADPQAAYRVHGVNAYASAPLELRLRRDLEHDEFCHEVLRAYCRRRGIDADPAVWRRRSWNHRLHRMVEALKAVVPPGETLILVDDAAWGAGPTIDGRRAIPFLERDGVYWGAPQDDGAAVAELARLREAGAGFIVFASPALWWLDHYAELSRRLRSCFPCVLEDDELVVFRLRGSARAPEAEEALP